MTWLYVALRLFESQDDVFSLDFIATILLVDSPGHETSDVESVIEEVAKLVGHSRVYHCGIQHWPQGPYFLHGGNLHQAWRLYPDTSEAFYITTAPHPTEQDRQAIFSLSYHKADIEQVSFLSRSASFSRC
jgi:hypothetical protein